MKPNDLTVPLSARAVPGSDLLAHQPSQAPANQHFLTVGVGGRRLALRREEVREVVLLTELLEVPGMPPHLVGFCVHRGAVWPVVDLAQLLGGERLVVTSASAMIFLAGNWRVALLVDEAIGLQATASKMGDVEPGCTWNETVAGIAEIAGEAVPVISCQRVMSEEEKQRLEAWCLLAQRRLETQPNPPTDAAVGST